MYCELIMHGIATGVNSKMKAFRGLSTVMVIGIMAPMLAGCGRGKQETE